MKIINDPRKHELFRILKNLYYLAEKDRISEFKSLKLVYNRLLRDIFGNCESKSEGWEWDNARNGVDGIFTLRSYIKKTYIKDEPEKRRYYEGEVIAQIAEALKRIKKIENYLK